ncbi:unnamed protein product [Linum trigynum]
MEEAVYRKWMVARPKNKKGNGGQRQPMVTPNTGPRMIDGREKEGVDHPHDRSRFQNLENLEEESTEEVDKEIIMKEPEGNIMEAEDPREPLPEVKVVHTEEGEGSAARARMTKREEVIHELGNPQGSNEKQMNEKKTARGLRGDPTLENNGKECEFSEEVPKGGEQHPVQFRNTNMMSVGDISSNAGG